jgi:hypothetical protein
MAIRSFAELFIERLETFGYQGWKLIDELVSDQKAEDVYLDFVEKADPTTAALSIDDNRNLSKAISGFAHSDGGILIWGVSARRDVRDPESPDVARDAKPIHNLDAFYTNLNAAVRSATRPPVDGVLNYKVPKNPNCGFVVTYVPVGLRPPYRADNCNNNFYKRAGSSFYPMEPYDVRDVILRDQYPKITLEFGWTFCRSSRDAGKHLNQLILTLHNAGPKELDRWKLVIEYPEILSGRNLEGARPWSPCTVFLPITKLDGSTWEKLEMHSHHQSNPGLNFRPIMPEDDLLLLGPESVNSLYYGVADNITREMHWRFYAENSPAQRGQITIGPGSFQKY